MAAQTGMGITDTSKENSHLTEEQREMVAKARRPMEIANKFRLFFLFIAVLALLFVYFGRKVWEGTPWFDGAVQNIYNFLLWDVLLMLISTFVKFFFVARYNHVVKQLL